MNLLFRSLLARLRSSRVVRPAAGTRRRWQPALEHLETRVVLSRFGTEPLPLAPPTDDALLGGESASASLPIRDLSSDLRFPDTGSEGGAATQSTGRYDTFVIARGLGLPTGLTFSRLRGSNALFFTEVPEPGVPGSSNTVSRLSFRSGRITELTRGEPEPTNIVQDRFGNLYWTCKSAGVILRMNIDGDVDLVLRDLEQPVGIAVDASGENLYYTEVPTPGVPLSQGGRNRVVHLDVASGVTSIVDWGDPEPTDIVVDRNGDLYWTCRSAGVIVRYDARTGETGVVLRNLQQPVGIALDPQGRDLYFTEVPTPGVPGSQGGMNRVSRYDLRRGVMEVINFGDPQPTDVTVDRFGVVYWTCTSAGVIVAAVPQSGSPGSPGAPGGASSPVPEVPPEENVTPPAQESYLGNDLVEAVRGDRSDAAFGIIPAAEDLKVELPGSSGGTRGRDLFFVELGLEQEVVK